MALRRFSSNEIGEHLTNDWCYDNPSYSTEEHRKPLLYESKPTISKRRRTETDIYVPQQLLSPDYDTEDAINLIDPNHMSTMPRGRRSLIEVDPPAIPPRLQRRPAGKGAVDRSRRQTVAVDGIYHASRAVSVEQVADVNDHTVDEDRPRLAYDSASDSDEFFLATEFDNPLPRSKCTQSVDYLDSLIREENSLHEGSRRRCTSVFDIHDPRSDSDYYEVVRLQKDVSPASSSFSDWLDLESLPPESMDGSSQGSLCRSPPPALFYDGDINDWVPSHDPDVIHSAREAREFTARDEKHGHRSKSETYLLDRGRSQSSTMLSDEVYMEDIECHDSFRRKLRHLLGLDGASTATGDESTNTSVTDCLNTSLTFRSPHKRTHEQLHTRLRRVLSSVSIPEGWMSDDSFNSQDLVNVNASRHRRRHRHDRWRTKSMPLDVNEFLDSYNTSSNDQRYERSKSAEVLNHLGEQSAFRLYQEIEDGESVVFEFDADERFIDSPLVVDYQLGLRHSPPPEDAPPDYDQLPRCQRTPAEPLDGSPVDRGASPRCVSDTAVLRPPPETPMSDDGLTLQPSSSSRSLPSLESCERGFSDTQPVTQSAPLPSADLLPPEMNFADSTFSLTLPSETHRVGLDIRSRYESSDDEIQTMLPSEAPQAFSDTTVRAELVQLGTPVIDRTTDRFSFVHATPIMLGTPCPTLTVHEENGTSLSLNKHMSVAVTKPLTYPLTMDGNNSANKDRGAFPPKSAQRVNDKAVPLNTVTGHNRCIPASAAINTNSPYKLADMEISCDGKRCRLVPSINAKKRRLSKPRQKKPTAPLPPTQNIEGKNVQDIRKDSVSSKCSGRLDDANVSNHRQAMPANESLSTRCSTSSETGPVNIQSEQTRRSPEIRDMSWIIQHYDVTGETSRLSSLSEIEYVV